jgi:hypothetical protein
VLAENTKSTLLKLKPLCAQVRNEYSTAQLQADFKAGLEDLMRGPDEEDMEARTRTIYCLVMIVVMIMVVIVVMRGPDDKDMEAIHTHTHTHTHKYTTHPQDDAGAAAADAAPQGPLADGHKLDVFCVCANDFLKITKIKSRSDGAPNTFRRAQVHIHTYIHSHTHTILHTL